MILGEVHTSMLQTSGALSTDQAAELLQLLPGSSVRTRIRPTRIAWSPQVFLGVDCLLAAANHRTNRIVGTVGSEVSLTEGHLLQAGTWTRVHDGTTPVRRSWPHYLSDPGTVEFLGSVRDRDVTPGFLAGPAEDRHLDAGAVNRRLLSQVQSHLLLNRRPPFASQRTRLRWAVRPPTEDQQRITLTLGTDGVRTLLIEAPIKDSATVHEFCADLALHDWLLSTLHDVVDRALSGRRRQRDVLARLRPALENLVHIWMPGGRVEGELSALWSELENRARLTEQWNTTVTRVRDYVAISVAEGLLEQGAPAGETTRIIEERP